MKPILSILTIIFALSSSAYTEPVIQTGHIGSVNMIAYSEANGGRLFSCGDDGTLKIWEVDTALLIASLRVSYSAINRIAVNPTATQVAVLEYTGVSSCRIHVWDWKKSERLYSVELEERPLFFEYSPMGNYLIYGRPDLASLVVLDSGTGKDTTRFADGFGIVSFISMSKTEKNIMTYQQSGKITYWEFGIEKKIAGYPKTTLQDLSKISASDSKRFIAAQSGDSLAIVDLVTGDVIDKTNLPGIVNTAISKDGKQIAAVVKTQTGTEANIFSFDGKKLKKTDVSALRGISSQLRDCCYIGNDLYFATGDGELKLLRENRVSVFSSNRLVRITDIAMSHDLVAVAAESKVLLVPIAVIEGKESIWENGNDKLPSIANPYAPDAGIGFLDEKKLCIWNRGEVAHAVSVYDLDKGETIFEYDDFESPIIQVCPIGKNILTLEKNGALKIIDPATGEHVFEYSAQGLNMVVPVSNDRLIGARNQIGKTASTLMSINSKTGETVPLNDASVFCYSLLFDSAAKRLYYLSIDRDGIQSTTSLKYRYGKDFESVKTLSSYKGEDFTATITGADKWFYTSLGYEMINATDGNQVTRFDTSGSVPRRLAQSGKTLCSLNLDLSVSIYDVTTKHNIFNFYLFEDNDWIALYPEGGYAISENGKKYITGINDL
jgi:WD40 repeat protein